MSKRVKLLSVLLLVLALLLAACAGDSEDNALEEGAAGDDVEVVEEVDDAGIEEEEVVVEGDVAAIPHEELVELGAELFRGQGCGGCHVFEAVGAAGAGGPPLDNLTVTAEERIADPEYTGAAESAEEYVLESIVDPGVYIVEGYPNIMPPYENLSGEELNALVTLLMGDAAE